MISIPEKPKPKRKKTRYETAVLFLAQKIEDGQHANIYEETVDLLGLTYSL